MIWRFTLNNTIEGALVLQDEPIGWADITEEIKRDMNWHGVFFEYTTSLQFYGEAYDYIKKVYDTQSREGYIGILIEYKADDRRDFATYYNGKLLIAKATFDCKDDCIVSVPIEKSGEIMRFKNRIDQAVDLNANEDFDGNALTPYTYLPTNIQLEPKAVVLRSISEYKNDVVPIFNAPSHTIAPGTGTQSIADTFFVQIPIDNINLNELDLNVMSPAWVSNGPSIYDSLIAPFTGVYECKEFIDSISIGIGDSYGPSPGVDVIEAWIIISVNNVNIVRTKFHSQGGALSSLKWITGNINSSPSIIQTLNLSQGDSVKFFVECTVTGTYPRDLFSSYPVFFTFGYNLSDISAHVNIRATIKEDPTPCDVYAINEVLSRCAEAITNGNLRVKSNYFGRTDSQPYTSSVDGCGSLEVLTKGLLIRQFPSDMPVSFQDVFNALNAIHNIGLGMEADTDRGGSYERVRVEPAEYFYDTSNILLSCDNIPELRMSPKPEWDPSTIEIGFEKWETENSMGLDEVCTRRTYRTTLSEVKNSITKVCKFIASGYSIEITRNKEYVTDATKDWRLDNDVFIICVKRNGDDPSILEVEQGEDCTIPASVTNVIDPATMYNYRITPVRNFMRWTKSLMSAYFTDVNSSKAKFIFTKGDGNFLAEGELINGCVLEGAAVAENEDISVSKFATATDAHPIFKNELVTFDYPLSLDQAIVIRNNPRGIIRYRTNSSGAWSEGYISSIRFKPNEGVATFDILPKY
jgi:hypothetical protein